MAFQSEYMARAVELAKKHLPSPNPRVGAVIVKDGRIVGEGAHERPGQPHAEIIALNKAQELAKGADLYVTLEPCVHVGRTGPCVKAIEKAGIGRVIVGLLDPDERVNGQGIKYLRDAGIDVVSHVDEEECKTLLQSYITHRTKGRPHITLKAAITLDGYLATTTNDSKWISSATSRQEAHRLRAESDAILVGINTVEKDNPRLTVRHTNGISPTRVVLDSSLKISPNSNLIQTASDTPVYLVYHKADRSKEERFSKIQGVSLIKIESENRSHPSLNRLMDILAQKGILSLLVEGGGKIHTAFLKSKLVDQLVLFIAPKILGRGIPFSTFPGADTIKEGLLLSVDEISRLEDDILYRAKIDYVSKLKS